MSIFGFVLAPKIKSTLKILLLGIALIVVTDVRMTFADESSPQLNQTKIKSTITAESSRLSLSPDLAPSPYQYLRSQTFKNERIIPENVPWFRKTNQRPNRPQLNPQPQDNSKYSPTDEFIPLGGPPTPGCNVVPVVNGSSYFTPIRILGSSETYMTGVTNSGVVIGNYRESPSATFRPFRAQMNPSGTYSGVVSLNKGGYPEALALGISSDGATTVGSICANAGGCNCTVSGTNCKLRAARWDSPTAQPQKLRRLGPATGSCQNPDYPCDDENVQSEAVAVSSNASAIAGTFLTTSLNGRGVRWTGSGAGTPQAILPPSASCFEQFGFCLSFGAAMNDLGTRIVGAFIDYSYQATPFPFNSYVWNVGQPTPNGTTLPALNTYPRREFARGISPDGIIAVGMGLNGSYIPYGDTPSGLLPPIDSNNRFNINDQDRYYVSEATVWKESSSWAPQTMGDLPDLPNTSFFSLFDSRLNDSSNGSHRSVGNSYGGGEANVENSEYFRTAVISPSFSGVQQVTRLKGELLQHFQLNIDNANPINPATSQPYKWQLIDARAISADGKTIVGTAICHGLVDEVTYGFVAHVPFQFILGDLNCDGVVDGDDIGPFTTALNNPTQYASLYPNCNINQADINQDGFINTLDIPPFVILLNYRMGDLNCDHSLDGDDIEPFTLAMIDPAEYASQYPNCSIILADFDLDGIISSNDQLLFILSLLNGGG